MERKQKRKNPHAVELGRLGGLVRSDAKKIASKENGRKGGLVKSRKKLWPRDAMRAGPGLDAAETESAGRGYSRPLRRLRHWAR